MTGFSQSEYFRHTRQRPDRAKIRDEWIEHVIAHPEHEETQSDGRIRKWREFHALKIGRYGLSFLRME